MIRLSRFLSKVITYPQQNPDCRVSAKRCIHRSGGRKLRGQGDVDSSGKQEAHVAIITRRNRHTSP